MFNSGKSNDIGFSNPDNATAENNLMFLDSSVNIIDTPIIYFNDIIIDENNIIYLDKEFK